MKRVILFTAANLLMINFAFTQGVAINDNGAAADSSAILDINSSDKGILVPKVNLLSVTDVATITNPATGLLVYNTNSGITNGTGVGFYVWKGSAWFPVLQPSNSATVSGQILTSNASGKPDWKSITCFTHFIGELYGGGIVFCVYYSGGVEHGLIASLTDMADEVWTTPAYQTVSVPTCTGCTGCDASSVGAQSGWNGLCNTYAILDQNTYGASAALNCVNHNGGGYSDWYLPSIDELNKLYLARFVINKTLGSNGIGVNYYWSSTEAGANNAWVYNIGLQVTNAKSTVKKVRAVRAF